MRIRGHSAVLWRKKGESQVGAEPGHATVVTGLSGEEQRLLDGLPRTLERGSLSHAARRVQVPASRARQLLEDLEHRGAVVRGSHAELRDPDSAYWERLGLSPKERGTALASSTIALCGRGPLLQETALWLAEAGVGTILSAARAEDGGADQVLAAHFPAARTRAPLGTRPDLVLTVDSHVVEPLQARRLAQERLLHLPVLVREVSARVGPLLGTASGPCSTCLDLWERDSDPCWPALATQMRILPPPRTERLLVHQVAALAARAATDTLLAAASAREPGACGHEAWEATSVELTGRDPAGTRRHWTRHAQCLCSQVPQE